MSSACFLPLLRCLVPVFTDISRGEILLLFLVFTCWHFDFWLIHKSARPAVLDTTSFVADVDASHLSRKLNFPVSINYLSTDGINGYMDSYVFLLGNAPN